MSEFKDYKSDIDSWAEMWDEMQGEDIHPEIQKPKALPETDDFIEDQPSDSYYDYLDGHDELFSEEKEVVATQNPVRMDTVGPDNEQPKPAWVREDLLDEIEKLKERLFKVENEMARMGQGDKPSKKPIKNENKSKSKIESIRKEIDRLSDELGIENDPTPYKVKTS